MLVHQNIPCLYKYTHKKNEKRKYTPHNALKDCQQYKMQEKRGEGRGNSGRWKERKDRSAPNGEERNRSAFLSTTASLKVNFRRIGTIVRQKSARRQNCINRLMRDVITRATFSRAQMSFVRNRSQIVDHTTAPCVSGSWLKCPPTRAYIRACARLGAVTRARYLPGILVERRRFIDSESISPPVEFGVPDSTSRWEVA